MKQFMFLALFLSGLNVNAQKFRAFQEAVSYSPSPSNDDIVNWKIISTLITIDLSKRKIRTYGKTIGDYDLSYTKVEFMDNSRDFHTKYNAVDKSGDKCVIELLMFADANGEHVATMFVSYPKFTIAYRLKRNERIGFK